jgi:hypothetical protein
MSHVEVPTAALASHRSVSLVVVKERVPFSSSLPSRMPLTIAHATQFADDVLAVKGAMAEEATLALTAAAVVGDEAVLRHCRIRAASTPPCDATQDSAFDRERDAPLQQSEQAENDDEDEDDAVAH